MSPPTQPSAPRELADSPVRFVLSQPNADGAPDSGNVVLACPVCACPEVHIGQAAVMQRATLVLHRDDGMHASPANVNRRRGSYVALRFWCEQGHAFRYEYLFTKGATHVRLLTGGYDPQGEHELWRE